MNNYKFDSKKQLAVKVYLKCYYEKVINTKLVSNKTRSLQYLVKTCFIVPIKSISAPFNLLKERI